MNNTEVRKLMRRLDDDVRNLEKSALDSLKNKLEYIRNAYDLIKKSARFLPDKWEVRMTEWGDVYMLRSKDTVTEVIDGEEVVRSSRVDAEEFRQVVKHMERITGVQFARDVEQEYGSDNVALKARGWWNRLSIDIRLSWPDCKVSFETIEVPASTKRVVVVPPECLGERKETVNS